MDIDKIIAPPPPPPHVLTSASTYDFVCKVHACISINIVLAVVGPVIFKLWLSGSFQNSTATCVVLYLKHGSGLILASFRILNIFSTSLRLALYY